MIFSDENGKHLSESERSVMEYINEHQNLISEMSISNIAEKAFVSNATVSRAIRKCGFGSLFELKYRLSLAPPELHKSYTVNQILSKSYRECIQTLQSIDIPAILQIIHMMRVAERVFVIANGLTALVAQEFTTYLQYQKINAWCISDTNVMRVMDRLITKDDLLIVVSVKNTMPELSIAAGLAKAAGGKVATLCCKKGTELEEYSDFIVYGSTLDLGPHLAVDTTSRLGLYIITRTITEYMYSNDE